MAEPPPAQPMKRAKAVPQIADTPRQQRQSLRLVSLKNERLTRKVALIFGFMSFIPLLLMVWAFVSFVFPAMQGPEADSLRLLLLGIIVSIFVGYVVLKRTMNAVLGLVNQARVITPQQVGEPVETAGVDEIGELARTFNRITQELERKIDELESSRTLIKRLLTRIGSAIVSYEGIDNLLGLIVENIVVALGAHTGSLMLVDGDTHELKVKTAWSVDDQPVHVQGMKFGEGIAGWVAKTQRPMRGASAPGTVGLPDRSGQESAVLCVPLLIRETAIGVLSVLRDDPTRHFTEDDESLLTNIGSQMAVAIENYRLNLDIERTYLETVMALALAVEAKDPYSAGHSKRVGFYAVKIAEALGADAQTTKILKDAGLLHDVGKIGIKDEILLKTSALTPEEVRIIQQHTVIGEVILKPVRSLGKVAALVRCHHENYDGSGYPQGLIGEAIPWPARILAVADTYDSMVTDRPYRKRMSVEHAKAELRKGSGTQFDPKVVDAFLQVLAEKDARQG